MKKLIFPFSPALPLSGALLSAGLLCGCGAQSSATEGNSAPLAAAPASDSNSAQNTTQTGAAEPATATPTANRVVKVASVKRTLLAAASVKVKKKAAKPGRESTKLVSELSGAPDPRYRIAPEGLGAAPPNAPAAVLQLLKTGAAALKAAQVPPPPANFKVPAKVRVRLDTSKGPITVELDSKAAALHVKSFVYLARRGFFDGTIFHRWADLTGSGGSIIQGGDPLTKNPALSRIYGGGGPGYQIPREHNSLTHQKLVIAAARTNDPDSAGSQFYLTQNPTLFLDQGDGYTVFGKVIQGQSAALALRQDDKLKSVRVVP